jgi:hypothetical protein
MRAGDGSPGPSGYTSRHPEKLSFLRVSKENDVMI